MVILISKRLSTTAVQLLVQKLGHSVVFYGRFYMFDVNFIQH